MLDIKFIRENPDVIKKDLKKRNEPEKIEWVDELIKEDEKYRNLLGKSQKLRHKRNTITNEINQLKKERKSIKEKIKEAKELPDKIKDTEENIQDLKEKIHSYLMQIPNLLHKSVPVGKDGEDNKVVRKVGEIRKFNFELIPHHDIIENLGLGNFDSAAKNSGHGFYYLFGKLALMELALQRFAIDLIIKKGYNLVEPPLMLRRKPYEGVTDLKDFETMMYKIDGEDLYLIATSEHPIGALYSGHLFNDKDLPKKFVGVSPCFRKELGTHSVDERGLFRVHHFNKVEMFIYSNQEDSWKHHEELLANAEEIFKKLKLPYRIVNICTGDIGTVAAKKYDLEVYMPREEAYKEAVSCSNCTSYQATRLNIKYTKGNKKYYVHTLNSTAIATSRALRAIIENYQQKDGSLKVPAALVPYMNGIKDIKKEA